MASAANPKFTVLGPLGVTLGGIPLGLGGPRRRLVLAYLVVHVGTPVTADRLMDEIWRSAGRLGRTGPLRTYIWELRRLLAGQAGNGGGCKMTSPIVSADGGYVLNVDRHDIDSHRFETALAEATALVARGDRRAALDVLDGAHGMWRGPAFGDLAGHPAIQLPSRRLDELRLRADEMRYELLIDEGMHADVVGDLWSLARAHPERERLWEMLMLALARAGRRAEALRCYQEARGQLVSGYGIEPGPGLKHQEQAILNYGGDHVR